ncbi:hypothetical protein N7517_007956 [Penicillium concentricum]|uniref:Uncharacterized protein n=1 Tax=Penicillium concentricum TaxID=293559 RepID=A0A9W9RSY6_9EURO|nr:uncharacterized protein N7517_007956 [Penicillium concentricum]KAJ5365070.1 hypothetical protein N7517_007956 [Penicillium concentricum]
MIPAIQKEKIQASAYLEDPTHPKQVKDLLDGSSSDSIETVATKKRKRGDRSGAKHLRMSSSKETLTLGSIHSRTPKTSKSSRKSSHKRDGGVTKSEPSDQQISNEAPSAKPKNRFELPGFPPSEFIVPRDLELGLGIFDCPPERETSYEPVSEYLPEQHDEVPTPYTPVLRGVSQYNERIRSQCGGTCENWLARQMYDELDDISTRIEDIMRGIRVMLEQKGAMDDCEDFDGFDHHFGDYHFEESPGVFEGGPENPLELSDGENNALFVADERARPSESGVVSGDE